jgi:hypothetical protein
MLALMHQHIPYLLKLKMARRGKHAHELNMHNISTKHNQKNANNGGISEQTKQ